MLSDPIQSTQDLRSRAVDRKREKQQKEKWSPAWAVTSDIPTFKAGPNDTKRPLRLPSNYLTNRTIREQNKEHHRKRLAGKQDALSDKVEQQESEGSSSSASEPDQDELHVRDRDPALFGSDERGQTVLAMALDRAVAKFEDTQTTMLVKNEYEVLDDSDIEKEDSGELANEDDDYELV